MVLLDYLEMGQKSLFQGTPENQAKPAKMGPKHTCNVVRGSLHCVACREGAPPEPDALLSLFKGQPENQPKEAKKKPRRQLPPTSTKRLGRHYGPTFYGKTIPPIFGADGQLIACPCGRVHIMPAPEGDGAFLYDTQGVMGSRKISLSKGKPRYIEPNLAKLKELLDKYGCNVHATLPAAQAADDKQEPRLKPWQK